MQPFQKFTRTLAQAGWVVMVILPPLLLPVNVCPAASPLRVPQTFTYSGDVGFGNSVFVAGNHADVGNWNPTNAVKLRWTTGNVWTGSIAIQAGTALQYKFIRRSTDPAQIFNPTNAVDLGPMLTRNVPAQPAAPYVGKTILYHSAWPRAFIHFRSGTNWLTAEMTRSGAGRTDGENLYRLSGIGEAGETLEFVPNDGAGQWDNPPGGGNYLTTLDVLFLQDKNVFNYSPPATVSPAAIQTTTVSSSYPAIPARPVRVYLPRGYAQNTLKRYPVFYFHDGQNVFDPGGPFGSWSADAIATTEISQGRMRECILVGVNNTANRLAEYLPPVDNYNGTVGVGNQYRDYLVNNVRPYINSTYRTLTNVTDTLTGGSSMGGLISLYLGRESPNFGKIAVVSPALWVAPNYMAQVRSGVKKPACIYLDMGTAETLSAWNDFLGFHDTLLSQGYAFNGDAWSVVGCGQQHNEAAWKKRLPGLFRYLLNPWDESNPLAHQEFPARLSLTNFNATIGQASLYFTGLFGRSYEAQRSADLVHWITVTNIPAENLPWSEHLVSDVTAAAQSFWRLRYGSD